jgi:hypothetical protein
MPLALQIEPDELGMLRIVVSHQNTCGHGRDSRSRRQTGPRIAGFL